MNKDGVLLVDKASGWSSHDVVAKARRFVGTRKIGHAGTLDPMATGLLILGVNRGTKLLNYLIHESKSYEAALRLGQSTLTDDAEGDIVSTTDTSRITDENIREQIAALTGDIMQVPTSVSAIKVNGERAYAKVRNGEEVKLQARPVTVSEFSVHAITRTDAFIDVSVTVTCSAGTYIRALARDIGQSLGVGGHLTALRRTSIGSFSVDNAVSIESLEQHIPLISLDEIVPRMYPVRTLDETETAHIIHGRPIAADEHEGIYAACYADEVIALLTNKGKGTRIEMMVKIA